MANKRVGGIESHQSEAKLARYSSPELEISRYY